MPKPFEIPGDTKNDNYQENPRQPVVSIETPLRNEFMRNKSQLKMLTKQQKRRDEQIN